MQTVGATQEDPPLLRHGPHHSLSQDPVPSLEGTPKSAATRGEGLSTVSGKEGPERGLTRVMWGSVEAKGRLQGTRGGSVAGASRSQGPAS